MPASTQADRQGGTARSSLVRAARKVFAEHGYAGATTQELAREAGTTRGALYRHFRGKKDLFEAVHDELGRELVERVTAATIAEPRPEKRLETGCGAFLDVCLEPDHQRICLQDGPSVLGWRTWRESGADQGFGLVAASLEAAMDAGYVEEQPISSLAHLVFGALMEAGVTIARADDVAASRDQMAAALARLLEGFRPGATREVRS